MATPPKLSLRFGGGDGAAAGIGAGAAPRARRGRAAPPRPDPALIHARVVTPLFHDGVLRMPGETVVIDLAALGVRDLDQSNTSALAPIDALDAAIGTADVGAGAAPPPPVLPHADGNGDADAETTAPAASGTLRPPSSA